MGNENKPYDAAIARLAELSTPPNAAPLQPALHMATRVLRAVAAWPERNGLGLPPPQVSRGDDNTLQVEWNGDNRGLELIFSQNGDIAWAADNNGLYDEGELIPVRRSATGRRRAISRGDADEMIHAVCETVKYVFERDWRNGDEP